MQEKQLDVIVVGAGHAGVSASYYLKKKGLHHIVIERGRIGESWRSQRWDSFVLNTSNKMNLLPDEDYKGKHPDGFSGGTRFAAGLKLYVTKYALPVIEQTTVTAIEQNADKQSFIVTVNSAAGNKKYFSRQVIICSGAQNTAKIPLFAENINTGTVQMHVSNYRNEAQLPAGAVLVAGSAQSGFQVAADLAAAGRKVYLSTSMVPRIPRQYRGRDIMDWLILTGFFTTKKADIPDPGMWHLPAPQLTGTGSGKETISLQALAKKGISILGKLKNAENNQLFFSADAKAHVHFADEFSARVKHMIDDFILNGELNVPAAEKDAEDAPDPDADCIKAIDTLDVNIDRIGSIIWATGFGADFNYIKLPVLNMAGEPLHINGISSIEGLYFLGLPGLRTRQSALIYGIKQDAAFITNSVYEKAQQFFGNGSLQH